jgi:hypothetical protein
VLTLPGHLWLGPAREGSVNLGRKSEGENALFRRGLCGEEPAHVALVPAGEPDPRLTPETPEVPQGVSTLMSHTSVLSVDGGPVSFSISVGETHFEDVKNALLGGDAARLFAINHEYAPFCRKHYASWAEI